jgi:PHD finger-like domain-containing protein 5A
MARHHPDLIMCRKQPGISVGKLCEKCDGRCIICDSYVRQTTQVRICDECNYGASKCLICGTGQGVAEAFYCKECTQCEKDRDGCPRIINISQQKLDMVYANKRPSNTLD